MIVLFFRAFILVVLIAIAAAVLVAAAVIFVIDVMPVDGPAVQTVPATTTQTPAATRQ